MPDFPFPTSNNQVTEDLAGAFHFLLELETVNHGPREIIAGFNGISGGGVKVEKRDVTTGDDPPIDTPRTQTSRVDAGSRYSDQESLKMPSSGSCGCISVRRIRLPVRHDCHRLDLDQEVRATQARLNTGAGRQGVESE